jgi:hypothetical protein
MSGSYVGHAFDSSGTHTVSLQVVYAVSYRLKGSATWISEPDRITLSDDLQVDVSGGTGSSSNNSQNLQTKNRVLLVGDDCLKQPASFGCN